jgi:hypothetical protein
MPALQKTYFPVFILSFALLSLNHAIQHQSARAQSMLPAGMEIKQVYQAGSGLPVGKIQSIWGDVIIIHTGAEDAYPARVGLPLFSGDTIITDRHAGFSCRLKDGSTVKLAAESKLKIDFSEHDFQRRSSITLLSLLAGRAGFQVAKLDAFSPREFKVETGRLFIWARQARFAVFMLAETTEVIALRDSLLEVMNLDDPAQTIILSQFQRAEIRDGELPSTVEIFPEEKAGQFLSAFQRRSDNRWSSVSTRESGAAETDGDEYTREQTVGGDIYYQEFP